MRLVIILKFGKNCVDVDLTPSVAKTCSAKPLLVGSVRFRYEECDWFGLK